jgi:hypothetical protein
VNIGAQPNVIGQIPPDVIRIVIDHDVIRSPIPIATIADIVWRNREEEAAESEPLWATSAKPPDVTSTYGSGKMSVFPSPVDVIVRVTAPSIVADPLIVLGVNVRSLWMPRLVSKRAPLRSRRRLMRSSHRSRSVRRNVATADSALSTAGTPRSSSLVSTLREHRDSKQ